MNMAIPSWDQHSCDIADVNDISVSFKGDWMNDDRNLIRAYQ